jgi:hypothetical protein
VKLYYAHTESGPPDLAAFLETLEPKLRRKLVSQFLLLTQHPMPREPTVKSFSIEKYRGLYELRARSKIMVRIIFTLRDGGGILFLTPFIKSHKRNTMQALDTSLKLLAQTDSGACEIRELALNQQIL